MTVSPPLSSVEQWFVNVAKVQQVRARVKQPSDSEIKISKTWQSSLPHRKRLTKEDNKAAEILSLLSKAPEPNKSFSEKTSTHPFEPKAWEVGKGRKHAHLVFELQRLAEISYKCEPSSQKRISQQVCHFDPTVTKRSKTA